MRWFGQVVQDLRYGVRVLARHRGTTGVIVLSLALGIGANTIVFSLVNAILLKSLPYPDPDRLVTLWFTPPNRPDQRAAANSGVCLDLAERGHELFEHVGCYLGVAGNFVDASEVATEGPEWLNGEMLTYEVAQATGVRPQLGRWFTREEDHAEAEKVILISHALWQRRFAGASDVLGRRVRVPDFAGTDTPSTIVGVMPPGFAFADSGSDYFIPLRNSPRLRRSPPRNRLVAGRLDPGVSLAQAQAAADALAARYAEENPTLNEGWGIRVEPLSESRVGGLRAPFQILHATAGLVLLIACANVAGLLLAQGATRQRELAVRVALGSSRWRIVRQLLTESTLFSALGGVLCLALAGAGLGVLVSWLPPGLPRLDEVGLDSRVLAFTVVVSVATALVFGILPALQVSRPDLVNALKESGRSATASRSRQRLRSAFVVLQISLALVLLAGAGLLLNSLLRLYNVQVGFDPRDLTTFRMSFTGQQFFRSTGNTTPSGSVEMELSPRINLTAMQLRDRLLELPGVEAVSAVASTRPLSGGARSYRFTIEGQEPAASEQDALSAQWFPVLPEYLAVLQAPVLRGREFTDRDSASGPPVALINQTMAQRYWPGEDPIGARIAVDFFNDVPREIVGVVGDIQQNIYQLETQPQIYVPHAQLPVLQAGATAFGLEDLTFVVRARAGAADWVPVLRAAAVEVDPVHAITTVQPLEQYSANQTQGRRQFVALLSVFSAIALVLAIVGIYGIMAHSVTQRTSEIGIRVAFGAGARDVLRLVLRQGLMLIGIGMAVGLGASLALTRVIRSALWGVTATDPLTFAVALSVLFTVAFLACYIPARRALRIDPMNAMRHD
jgi:putative ABC transport system permease protein